MTVYIKRISDAANGNPRYLLALADIAPKFDDAMALSKKLVNAKFYRSERETNTVVFSSYAPIVELKQALGIDAEHAFPRIEIYFGN